MKRTICDVVFDVISPSHYKRDSLQLYYAGLEFGWRLKDGGYNDPESYGSKEGAVMRHILTMQNFG